MGDAGFVAGCGLVAGRGLRGVFVAPRANRRRDAGAQSLEQSRELAAVALVERADGLVDVARRHDPQLGLELTAGRGEMHPREPLIALVGDALLRSRPLPWGQALSLPRGGQ